MIVRVIALCVAASMICSALRVQRPEIATAVSLASGLAALALVFSEWDRAGDWLSALREFAPGDGDITSAVLKGAGIAILSRFGAQLCEDAGERALAGRISLSARIAMLGLCAPMLSEIAKLVRESLQ